MTVPMSIDDPQRDDWVIIQSFMKELCRRDDLDRNHVIMVRFVNLWVL